MHIFYVNVSCLIYVTSLSNCVLNYLKALESFYVKLSVLDAAEGKIQPSIRFGRHLREIFTNEWSLQGEFEM